MTLKLLTFLDRFRRNDDGFITIEFALAVPLIFTLFLTSVEMGIYAVRQNFLDRGLDMAVRDIRLNTGAEFSHAEIKSRVCQYSGFLEDCDIALTVQMSPVNPRAFAGFAGSATCADVSMPPAPPTPFAHGSEHQLMLVRACYVFRPVFPSTGMGRSFTKDSNGRVKMVSLSGFVQEPNS